MRIWLSAILIALAIAVVILAFRARRSGKPIGPSVSLLLIALLPPMIGNLMIIVSGDRDIANAGSLIYFVGMDLVMFALLNFTFGFCSIKWPSRILQFLVYAILVADATSLLLNPVFGHAFTLEPLQVEGSAYYILVPLLGQTIHRIIDYTVFLSVLIIFLVKVRNTPKINSERYIVILLSMVFIGLWQTFYVFSGTPVDRSMIGYGVFGLLVYFFAIYYRSMRLLDSMLSDMASRMTDAVYIFDGAGECVWANGSGKKLTGMPEDSEIYEAIPRRLRKMFGYYEQQNDDWSSRHMLGEGEDARYYIMKKRSTLDKKGRVTGSLLSIHDNTDDQKALLREKYNATHDTLTGLLNKEYLSQLIEERTSEDQDTDYMVGVLNVSNFKLVNDVFGNDFGDYTLRCIGEWLRISATENMVFGRLGGDNFGIFLPVEEFNEEYVENLLADFVVEDDKSTHHILMQFGVYEISEEGLDAASMFDRARIALSTIKGEYKKYIAVYDEAMRDEVLWSQQLSNQLEEAIAERQIRPYLQPMVDRNGKIVGAEALVRWDHPTYGFLSPARFIPVFEENGMIATLDRYIWRCACEILVRWKEKGIDTFISVNISPKDFYFMDVAAELMGIVSEYDIDPAKLRIEITETIMMTEVDARIKMLEQLREFGFTVEMDDFGSGYSSLNMLKDIPVDVIKIDMVFLTETSDENKAKKILHSVITLSNELKIESLTEGVETEPQYRMLKDMGCRLFQGFYFSKPMPVEDFERFCEIA